MVGKNMRDPKRILKRSFNFFHIFLEIIQGSCGKKIKKKKTLLENQLSVFVKHALNNKRET